MLLAVHPAAITVHTPSKAEPGAPERAEDKAGCAVSTSSQFRWQDGKCEGHRRRECCVPKGKGAFFQVVSIDFPSDSCRPS